MGIWGRTRGEGQETQRRWVGETTMSDRESGLAAVFDVSAHRADGLKLGIIGSHYGFHADRPWNVGRLRDE